MINSERCRERSGAKAPLLSLCRMRLLWLIVHGAPTLVGAERAFLGHSPEQA